MSRNSFTWKVVFENALNKQVVQRVVADSIESLFGRALQIAEAESYVVVQIVREHEVAVVSTEITTEGAEKC